MVLVLWWCITCLKLRTICVNSTIELNELLTHDRRNRFSCCCWVCFGSCPPDLPLLWAFHHILLQSVLEISSHQCNITINTMRRYSDALHGYWINWQKIDKLTQWNLHIDISCWLPLTMLQAMSKIWQISLSSCS